MPCLSAPLAGAHRRGALLALESIVMLNANDELFGAPRPRLERVSARRSASALFTSRARRFASRGCTKRVTIQMYADRIECELVKICIGDWDT
jgi:hypothetical protein